MQILPSLLEYSSEELKKKIKVLQNRGILSLLNQKELNIHLDFVLEYFAKERNILQSLSFDTVHNILMENFKNDTIHLTVHLMGEPEDIHMMHDVLTDTNLNSKWTYIFLVPEKYLSTFSFLNSNISKVGIWYDLGEWKPPIDNTIPYLLMTVKAGLSGQKRSDETTAAALEFTKKYPNYFILDGGWKIDTPPINEHTDIVSHSSFWNTVKPPK